eukprot:1228148-Rhodomonas_salina.1
MGGFPTLKFSRGFGESYPGSPGTPGRNPTALSEVGKPNGLDRLGIPNARSALTRQRTAGSAPLARVHGL